MLVKEKQTWYFWGVQVKCLKTWKENEKKWLEEDNKWKKKVSIKKPPIHDIIYNSHLKIMKYQGK